MRALIRIVFFLVCTSVVLSAQPQSTPDTLILMHSRMGIRIEYDLTKQELALWISPQAGKSIDYHVRNFSNRDDHTSLFDRISFPNLSLDEFVRCDYDPFHSVVHFKHQTLHIASLFDQPAVLVWFDQPEEVDLKTDKSDRNVERSAHMFAVEHSDRGMDFGFAAALSAGSGTFEHQLVVDAGRSTYARAHLGKEQLLVFAGELTKEHVSDIARIVAAQSTAKTLQKTETLLAESLRRGNIHLRNLPELQKLIDVNKRYLVSMQDASGAQRDTAMYIYYLMWVRNGGITYPPMANAGWVEPLRAWNEFQFANPTVVANEEPKGRMFGQLVNNITKWEEDGAFYAILSAFTYWTQTGDKRFMSGENLRLLEDSMDWVERRCYDPQKGLFGRYYQSEAPLYGSRDYGWDNAVGFPGKRWPVDYKGKVITRSYDVYINQFSYASYQMLAAAESGEKADQYLRKADALAQKIQPWLDKKEDGLPAFGEVISNDNETIPAGPYGQINPADVADYEWALTVPPLAARPWEMLPIQRALFDHMKADPKGYFLAAYFNILTSVDTDWMDEREIMKMIDYAAQQSYPPGKYLPMPYTMKEMSDYPDGDSAHDVRPETFTSGPWYGTMAAFGVRKLPFGIAVRPTRYLDRIDEYEYKGGLIDVTFSGDGPLQSATLNGKELQNTLQIPDSWVQKGKNTLAVTMGKSARHGPLLVSSTVRLADITRKPHQLVYDFEAFGNNVLVFRNLTGKAKAETPDKHAVPVTRIDRDGYVYLTFAGRGRVVVAVESR